MWAWRVPTGWKKPPRAVRGWRRTPSAPKSLKPYREAEKARMRMGKANVNALYQKHIRDNSQLAALIHAARPVGQEKADHGEM